MTEKKGLQQILREIYQKNLYLMSTDQHEPIVRISVEAVREWLEKQKQKELRFYKAEKYWNPSYAIFDMLLEGLDK